MFSLNALLNNEWFVDHVYFSSGNKFCNSEGEKDRFPITSNDKWPCVKKFERRRLYKSSH